VTAHLDALLAIAIPGQLARRWWCVSHRPIAGVAVFSGTTTDLSLTT
jgi:hypothetical protein